MTFAEGTDPELLITSAAASDVLTDSQHQYSPTDHELVVLPVAPER